MALLPGEPPARLETDRLGDVERRPDRTFIGLGQHRRIENVIFWDVEQHGDAGGGQISVLFDIAKTIGCVRVNKLDRCTRKAYLVSQGGVLWR